MTASLGFALTASDGAAQAPDRERAVAAFAQVAAVLTHPRCQNCHTLTDHPRQGDGRRRHAFNVRRGPDGHGVPGMRCAACHGRANNAASGVPGADEDWHLAPPPWGGRACRPGRCAATCSPRPGTAGAQARR